jgi:hypothetical protein
MKKLKLLTFALITTASLPLMAASSSSSKVPDWKLAEASEVWSPVPAVVTANNNTAPSDAIVLFDGKSLSQWQGAEGGEAKWVVKDGAFTVAPKTGDIKTKDSFCDVQLHVEWMTPTKITGDDGKTLEGQGRSNSGIFLQEQYEIQVLDSYNNKTYPNGQAGSVYKQHIPLVNPTRAPGVWQEYDIIYTAPKFSDDKKLTSPGRVTVLLNGVLVQNNIEIQGATAWIGKPVYSAHGCAPLRLQDHGNPVSFRNIWVRKL